MNGGSYVGFGCSFYKAAHPQKVANITNGIYNGIAEAGDH